MKAAELAEYTAKITLLEEAKKVKEQEANQWQNRVINSFLWACIFSLLKQLKTVQNECVW